MKAVIFDMDGVLVDSEPIYMNYFHTPFHLNNQKTKIQDLYPVIGTTMDDTWDILAETWVPKLTKTEMLDYFKDLDVDAAFKDYGDLRMPHLTHLLKFLKANKIKTAVASASPKSVIKRVLQECEIDTYFDFYVSGEEVNASKPAPDVYLKAMSVLNVKPENTLVIEDSTLGIQAGKSAGATVIAYKDNRFGLDQSKADYHVNDHMESYHQIRKLFRL